MVPRRTTGADTIHMLRGGPPQEGTVVLGGDHNVDVGYGPIRIGDLIISKLVFATPPPLRTTNW